MNSDGEEDKKLNPYNFNNELITENNIQEILMSMNIPLDPNNIEVYQRAFVHKSYSCKCVDINDVIPKPEGALPLMDTDNERLEFLGDSVIGLIVEKYLYERYENQDEGFLTKLKTKLVRGDALAYFAKELGFAKWIIMSRHVEDKCHGRNSTSILEDSFEAFIGALFTDFNEQELESNCLDKYDFYSGLGFQVCEQFMINLIEEKVDFSVLIQTNYNYKEQLIRHLVNKHNMRPEYSLISTEQDEYEKTFTAQVKDPSSNKDYIGLGTTKKKAEQEASKNALIDLGIIEDC